MALALLVIVGSVLWLPPGTAFWLSLAAVAVARLTAVGNAWGRHIGGLLVAPALALLFLMNIFPLLWSFGLSFFAYRANRLALPHWVGLAQLPERPHRPGRLGPPADHGRHGHPDRTAQMIVGFLLALLFEKQFPGRRVLLILVLTPMMLSFVAVGAFFRYYYDPTFGLLSQACASSPASRSS